MFTCNLDPNSRTTLTEQLYTALRGDMERGSIRPGERMPSKRELAAHLNISTATVEAAYARLISEGRCESRPEAASMPSASRLRRQRHSEPKSRPFAGISERARQMRGIFPTRRGRG